MNISIESQHITLELKGCLDDLSIIRDRLKEYCTTSLDHDDIIIHDIVGNIDSDYWKLKIELYGADFLTILSVYEIIAPQNSQIKLKTINTTNKVLQITAPAQYVNTSLAKQIQKILKYTKDQVESDNTICIVTPEIINFQAIDPFVYLSTLTKIKDKLIRFIVNKHGTDGIDKINSIMKANLHLTDESIAISEFQLTNNNSLDN